MVIARPSRRLPDGIHVPGWAVGAVTTTMILLGAGVTVWMKLQATVEAADADHRKLEDHLQWANDRNVVLQVVVAKADKIDAKMNQLLRLECYDAYGLENARARRRAVERLILADIDCGDLLGNKVPSQ